MIFMSNCKFEGVEKSLLRLLPPFFFFGGRSRLKPVIGYLSFNYNLLGLIPANLVEVLA